MLYARHSLNYQVSIRILRRLALAAAYPLRDTRLVGSSDMLRAHLANARAEGPLRYLALENFVHRSTDGPHNPFARVYRLRDVVADFPAFAVVDSYRRYLHAPPIPLRGSRAEQWIGWHLWVHLRARPPRNDRPCPADGVLDAGRP